MKTHPFRIGAIACAALYLILYLFLPVAKINLSMVGFSGSQILQFSFWAILPLIAVPIAAVCSLKTSRIIAAVVNGVLAFLPMIVVAICRNQILSMVGGTQLVSAFGSLVQSVVNLGLGFGIATILDLILGLGAAILCLLSDPTHSTRKHSATDINDGDMGW